jgi:hypothetical protein
MRCPGSSRRKASTDPRDDSARSTPAGLLSPDAFVKETLEPKPVDLHRSLSDSFQELNKRMRVRPDTVLVDADEIEE